VFAESTAQPAGGFREARLPDIVHAVLGFTLGISISALLFDMEPDGHATPR